MANRPSSGHKSPDCKPLHLAASVISLGYSLSSAQWLKSPHLWAPRYMGFLPWPLCEVGVVLTRSPLSANIGNALTRTDLGKDKSRGGPLFWDSRVVSEFQERCSRGLGALGPALSPGPSLQQCLLSVHLMGQMTRSLIAREKHWCPSSPLKISESASGPGSSALHPCLPGSTSSGHRDTWPRSPSSDHVAGGGEQRAALGKRGRLCDPRASCRHEQDLARVVKGDAMKD